MADASAIQIENLNFSLKIAHVGDEDLFAGDGPVLDDTIAFGHDVCQLRFLRSSPSDLDDPEVWRGPIRNSQDSPVLHQKGCEFVLRTLNDRYRRIAAANRPQKEIRQWGIAQAK